VVNNLPILLILEEEEEEEMVVVVVVRKNLGKGLKRVYDLFPIVSKFLLDSNSSFDFDVQRELYPVFFLVKNEICFFNSMSEKPSKKE